MGVDGTAAPQRWNNPLVLAVAGATIVWLGNSCIAWQNARLQRELEVRRSEQTLILEMIKSGDPDKAAKNLEFLLNAGLVSDHQVVPRLRQFLDVRAPGGGPYLPAAADPFAQLGRVNSDFAAKLEEWVKTHSRENPTPSPIPPRP